MAKAKTTPVAETIKRKANHLRGKAKGIRAAKSEIAQEFVTGFAEEGFKQAEILAGVFEVYVHAARATRTIFVEIERDPKFRAQIEVFVANVIEDASSRVNEIANIMDSVANSPEIQKAIEEAKLAIEGIVKHLESFAGLRKKSSKFSVIKTEDEGASEGETDEVH